MRFFLIMVLVFSLAAEEFFCNENFLEEEDENSHGYAYNTPPSAPVDTTTAETKEKPTRGATTTINMVAIKNALEKLTKKKLDQLDKREEKKGLLTTIFQTIPYHFVLTISEDTYNLGIIVQHWPRIFYYDSFPLSEKLHGRISTPTLALEQKLTSSNNLSCP